MGLAIARGIVEAHGGKIWIAQPPSGRGTLVCFYTDGLIERPGEPIDDSLTRLCQAVTSQPPEAACAAVKPRSAVCNPVKLGIVIERPLDLEVQRAAVGGVRDRDGRGPLAGAVVPLLLLAGRNRRARPPAAELAFAITLTICAVYIALAETFANWQACWFSAGLILLAWTLLQAKRAPD